MHEKLSSFTERILTLRNSRALTIARATIVTIFGLYALVMTVEAGFAIYFTSLSFGGARYPWEHALIFLIIALVDIFFWVAILRLSSKALIWSWLTIPLVLVTVEYSQGLDILWRNAIWPDTFFWFLLFVPPAALFMISLKIHALLSEK